MLTYVKRMLHFLGSFVLCAMGISDSDFRTPGQYLRALLDERGWNQQVVAAVLGATRHTVSKLTRDEKPVDAEVALALAEAFGVEPESFLRLQQEYDLALARVKARPNPARAHRARLYGDLPIGAMIGRGWLNVGDVRDVARVEQELVRFFGASSVDDIEVLPHAAKKTLVSGGASPTQLAWLHRVRQIAREMVAPRYSSAALVNAMKELGTLLAAPTEVRRAPRVLAEAGVRVVVVETLPGAKIDGVCFWLDERTPVIGLSLRFDRLDNFWFVLRHECEHVIRGHGRSAVVLDAGLEGERAGVGPDVQEEERVANEAAAEFCVPQRLLRQFIARKAPIFTDRDIVAFAKLVKVHPALVAGQLQRATSRYSRFRDHVTTVRDLVLPNVTHDGWGDVAPIGQPT